MRTLPNFVGGFVRPNKFAFARRVIEVRLAMATELLHDVLARRPSEDSLLADFEESKEVERECDVVKAVQTCTSVAAFQTHADEVAHFVDIAMTIYDSDCAAARRDVEGLTYLLRLIDTDIDAALALLECEMKAVTQTQDMMVDAGADRVILASDVGKARERFRAAFADELQFLGMLRAWLTESRNSYTAA